MRREAGVLMPIFSLPSRGGIGCFSREAYEFAELLAEAGQSLWQILPLGITGYGNSPYQCFSAFGGNPYFIDPFELAAEGLLTEREIAHSGLLREEGGVDYGLQHRRRIPLLRLAYERSYGWRSEERERFERENRWWLDDLALFMAARSHCSERPLHTWQEPMRDREPFAMEELWCRCGDTVHFHRFLQFCFDRQWRGLKAHANRLGVRMVGDLPIYLSADSADVWAHPERFSVDRMLRPTHVAGCPPDGFSPTGQLWGNPLYRWEAHEAEHFAFWVERFRHAFSLFDIVRVDHFRGFDEYYSIPANAPDATDGRWCLGPGRRLFEAVEEAVGRREIFAEDLGLRTESVRELVRDCGCYSMKLLPFGFEGSEDPLFRGEYLPHCYEERSVAYTGTHDNATLSCWLRGMSPETEGRLRHYLWDYETPTCKLGERLIALLMRSPSSVCIIPLADYLGLSEEGRINRPSVAEGNWRFRVSPDALRGELIERIRSLTLLGGRCGG